MNLLKVKYIRKKIYIANMSDSKKETGYTLNDFLAEHNVANSQNYTHTSINSGKYNIKEDELEIFYKLYEKAICDKKYLYLTERTNDLDFGPIIVDLDFNYENEILERQHNIEHIKKIVQIYNEVLIENLDIDEHDDRLKAFVFQRDDIYQKSGIKKDGVHILYPKIITFPQVQIYLRECILKKIKPILKDMPLINEIYDVVDRAVIYRNPWLMFGSRKPKLEAYQLTNIIDYKSNDLIGSYDFESANIAEFFSIRNKKSNEVIHMKEDKKENVEIKKTVNNKLSKKSKDIILDNFEEIQELVSILNIERCVNYTDWISLGWLLHNIDSESQELLDLWIEFSKKSEKYKDGICEKEWARSKNEGLGLPTLHYWAKIDNLSKYKDIIERSLNKLIETSIKTPTHSDIAKVLHRLYEYDFVYSNGDWYKYENHLWKKENDGVSLRKIISNQLPKIYMKVINKYNKMISSEGNDLSEQEKEDCKNKTKEILNIVKQLKTVSFKDNIMKESKENFYDLDFHKKLNSNKNLMGFKNGIYDFDACEFRDGRPDDYVQLSTNIEKIDFEETNEHFDDLKKFIDTIFVDEEVRVYFLTYLASSLHGHNAEEKFHIWTGSGSNGKSKFLELITNGFGDYVVKFPITLLTGKRGASNACNPEVIAGKGCRFGYFDEPDGIDNSKMNAGLLKEYTGGDKITARALHKEQEIIYPQWDLALLCNDIPEMPPHDGGVWRRMVIIEFKSKFTRKPKEPNEFPLDDQLSNKMTHWSEIFMSLLIDVYWTRYKKYGLKLPGEIEKFTKEIQAQNDLYLEFIDDNLEQTKENNDLLSMNELYDEFKVWYEETFSNHKFPSKKEIKNYLTKIYGKKIVTTKGLKGFVFKNKDDDNELLPKFNHDVKNGY